MNTSHRLIAKWLHASTFSTRPILLLHCGFMCFVQLRLHLLEPRQLPSHTCSLIILIWWRSGLLFKFWLHAHDAWNTKYLFKILLSPPFHIQIHNVCQWLWWWSSCHMRWWNWSQCSKETPTQQGKCCYCFFDYSPTYLSNILLLSRLYYTIRPK